jgi:hypothetical protein
MLREGDVIGTDESGRTIVLLALHPWTVGRLLAFDADAEDLEDADGEPEPDQEQEDGPATVPDFVPPKRLGRVVRLPQAVALALLLVTLPEFGARADQAPVKSAAPDVHRSASGTTGARARLLLVALDRRPV